ncbi:MAG: hypothetical protein V2I65_08200 [Paracoccaceae bacterium]|nr:hypothetical protein [Paracoccaceae bacterium]
MTQGLASIAGRPISGRPRSGPPPALARRLDAALGAAPWADACAYLDVGAGLVLGTSADPGLPQEALDGLCRAAGPLLDGAEGEAALVVSAAGLAALLAVPGEAGTALCLLLAPETPPAEARAAARAAVAAMLSAAGA